MDPQAILQRLGGKLNIPSLPEVIVRMNEMIEGGDVCMADLGAELAKDPPLAAKALRIANSAYYALQVPVVSIEHAASVLGMRSLKAMVMQALVLDLFKGLEKIPGFEPRELWKRSVLASRVAVDLPRRGLPGVSLDDLLLCGLLHDIGEFVLYDHLGEEYATLRDQVDSTGEALVPAEMRALGLSHVQVGALVAQRWTLPRSISKVAEFHHDVGGVAARNPLVAHIAYCDAIVDAVRGGQRMRNFEDWVPRGPRELLEYTEKELDPVFTAAQALWNDPV